MNAQPSNLPRAMEQAKPNLPPPAVAPLTLVHIGREPPRTPDQGQPLDGHGTNETQILRAGDATPPSPPMDYALPERCPEGWVELRIWAEMYARTQAFRESLENLTCISWTKPPRPGVDPNVFRPYAEAFGQDEHEIELELVRCYRRVVPDPIRAWQKAEKGIGELSLARLLGNLGHPVIATPYAWFEVPPDGHECDATRCGDNRHLVAGEPYQRSIGQLWQYCGHGGPSRRRKGEVANWNTTLKTLVFLNSSWCLRAKGHYREVYDKRRAETTNREWTKGHEHADALRIVGKEILRDLWLVGSSPGPEPPHAAT